jgi:hypothetical protein
MRYLILLIVSQLIGCNTIRGNTELVWQAGNIVDLGQTIHMASAPKCFKEINPVTRTIIGEHPSTGEVVGIFIVYGAGHALISKAIQERVEETNKKSWKALEVIWHALSLGTKGNTIKDNHAEGLRPFSDECKV